MTNPSSPTPPDTPVPSADPRLKAVAVVMPALNEAESLRVLLPDLMAFGLGQVIIGDNGSTDETAAVARVHGATVVSEPQRGYGAACWAAMQHIAPNIEVVLFLDADASDDPRSRVADPRRSRRSRDRHARRPDRGGRRVIDPTAFRQLAGGEPDSIALGISLS